MQYLKYSQGSLCSYVLVVLLAIQTLLVVGEAVDGTRYEGLTEVKALVKSTLNSEMTNTRMIKKRGHRHGKHKHRKSKVIVKQVTKEDSQAVSVQPRQAGISISAGAGISVSIGGSKTGEATYYATGLGACGITSNDSQMIAAVSHLLFDSYPGATANPNANPICGKKAQVNYHGKTVVVTLVDRCVGCAMYDLDLSPTAFSGLSSLDAGRLQGMTSDSSYQIFIMHASLVLSQSLILLVIIGCISGHTLQHHHKKSSHVHLARVRSRSDHVAHSVSFGHRRHRRTRKGSCRPKRAKTDDDETEASKEQQEIEDLFENGDSEFYKESPKLVQASQPEPEPSNSSVGVKSANVTNQTKYDKTSHHNSSSFTNNHNEHSSNPPKKIEPKVQPEAIPKDHYTEPVKHVENNTTKPKPKHDEPKLAPTVPPKTSPLPTDSHTSSNKESNSEQHSPPKFQSDAHGIADHSSDSKRSGDGTYYGTGLGSCGITNHDSDMIVAVSHLLYDSFPGATDNPNHNPVCGKRIVAEYGGKSVTVTVTDRCGGCKLEDLDFSPEAFSQLADQSVGRLQNVSVSDSFILVSIIQD
uniref:Riboflavin aldehyde-forming protein n=1 Tax=Hemileia vastatrix TaxID=203904 RepID=T1UNA7_9BASI|nr:riboflavin aldehyde-forming protein [Hemileia vastatrix]